MKKLFVLIVLIAGIVWGAEAQSKGITFEQTKEWKKVLKKAKKEKKIIKTGCILAVVICVCIAAWKFYDNYQEKHGPYITVGSHEIQKAEFDYYYYSSLNSFASTYGSYLSYFGLDTSKPLDQQQYSDTMTWDDYFQQQAVNQLKNVYALTDEANEKGFEYDASSDSGFNPQWHTVHDTMDHIDKETLKAVGQTVLAVIYNE